MLNKLNIPGHPVTSATPGRLPGVSLLGLGLEPLGPCAQSRDLPALSQEGAACLVTGTGALLDHGGCAGGLGSVWGVGTRGAPARPMLRTLPACPALPCVQPGGAQHLC